MDKVIDFINVNRERYLDELAWSGDLIACRRVVLAHGGSLEVERPVYGGYRVHLELPVTAGGPDLSHATAT